MSDQIVLDMRVLTWTSVRKVVEEFKVAVQVEKQLHMKDFWCHCDI